MSYYADKRYKGGGMPKSEMQSSEFDNVVCLNRDQLVGSKFKEKYVIGNLISSGPSGDFYKIYNVLKDKESQEALMIRFN